MRIAFFFAYALCAVFGAGEPADENAADCELSLSNCTGPKRNLRIVPLPMDTDTAGLNLLRIFSALPTLPPKGDLMAGLLDLSPVSSLFPLGKPFAMDASAKAPDAPPSPGAPAITFFLPPLPYDYDALEPIIDAQTMQIHHSRHHQAYVKKLNDIVSKTASLTGMSLVDILTRAARRDAVLHFNAGGHYNHALFWQLLASPAIAGASRTSDRLAKALDALGGVEGLQKEFSTRGLGVMGSGWVWLCFDRRTNLLSVTTTSNQDSPLASGLLPVMGVDVWEHAYYLKYKNKRADYIAAFWNVLNWDQVSLNFETVTSGKPVAV